MTPIASKRRIHELAVIAILATASLGRPSSGDLTTVATMAVPAGDNLTVRAAAFKEEQPLPGDAKAIAYGSTIINVQASQYAEAPIVMGLLSDPRIDRVESNVALVGDRVKLYGDNLMPLLADSSVATPDIYFGGIKATDVYPYSGPGYVSVRVPAGVTCGKLTATVGTSTAAPVTFYVSTGPTVALKDAKASWDQTADGEVAIFDGATRSFKVSRNLVLPESLTEADFPDAPTFTGGTSTQSVGKVAQDGVFTATDSTTVSDTTMIGGELVALRSNVITVKILVFTAAITPTATSINVPAPDPLPDGGAAAGFASTSQLAYSEKTNLFPTWTASKPSWASDATAKAKVDANGLVTAVAPGTVTILAKSATDPAKFATASVEVKNRGSVDVTVD